LQNTEYAKHDQEKMTTTQERPHEKKKVTGVNGENRLCQLERKKGGGKQQHNKPKKKKKNKKRGR